MSEVEEQLLNSPSYTSAIQNAITGARAQTVSGLDANPDEAARAVGLSATTGVPAQTIAGDLPGFEQMHRQALATHLVMNNPQLMAYVHSHPMAAAVSNDDWGNLDAISQAGGAFGTLHRALTLPDRAVKAGLGAAGEELERPITQYTSADVARMFPALDPSKPPFGAVSNALATIGLNLGSVIGEGGAEVFGALSRGAGAAAGAVGGPQFGREAQALTEYEMLKPEGKPEVIVPQKTPGHVSVIDASKTWVEAGREPPAGLHPDLDQAKALLNAKGVDALESWLQAAQASGTKERSPEMFRKFLDQAPELANASISIHGDAVAALYGDKTPEPNDGILGWVPGIGDKLELARQTGADVDIPVADWIASVDPAVAKGLHDDIRIWPGGVTAREAKEPIEPKVMVDSPLAQVRGASGLEPLFAIGDRKLTLNLTGKDMDLLDADGKPIETHIYDILDDHGKPVSQLALAPNDVTKQLYVQWIGDTVGAVNANSFGPSLIRDLKRQLKALYPDYDTLTGYRVSGARDKAGAYGVASVKLATPEGWDVAETANEIESTRQILGGAYEPFGQYLQIKFPTTEALTKYQDVIRAVDEEIQRITGGAAVKPTGGIRSSVGGVAGSYLPGTEHDVPWILYDLLGSNPIGTARHEAVHWLKNEGILNTKEWTTLWSAAENEGWLDKYHIEERYAHLQDSGLTTAHELKIEEAVAEGFRDWMRTEDARRNVQSPVGHIFQKLQDFFEKLVYKLGTALGVRPTWEEVFKAMDRGDIGKRSEGTATAPGAPRMTVDEDILGKLPIVERAANENIADPTGTRLTPSGWSITAWKQIQDIKKWTDSTGDIKLAGEMEKVVAAGPKAIWSRGFDELGLSDFGKGIIAHLTNLHNADMRKVAETQPRFSIDELDNLKANATGLDLKSWRRIQELIQERYRADVEASVAHAEKEQTRRQTKEWKENSREMAKDVEATIRQRPDVAADLFIGSGELYGTKVRQRYTLKAEDLTPEQRAALPDHYVSKNGLPVDEVAKLFGYGSGDAMVEKLAQYNALKGDLSPQEMLRKVVADETNRQMEAKYGNLGVNILTEAKDQALSENDLNILVEELQAMGMRTGQTTFDKAAMKAEAQRQVAAMPIGNLNSDKLMALMGKHGRDSERALIADDPATALVSMQRKTLAAFLTAEVRKVEKAVTSFDKLAKTMSKRVIPSMDPEYTNYVHQILMAIGKPVRRSVQDLQAQIAASPSADLEAFVVTKTGAFRELPVWDQLYDPQFRKAYDSLTVDEFRAVNGSVKALVANGRDELKIEKAGEKADFAVIKSQMVEELRQFKEIPQTTKGRDQGRIMKAIRTFGAQHMIIETLLNRWDAYNPQGVWNQYVMRDLIDAANQEDAYKKEFAKKLLDASDDVDLSRTVDNTLFRAPTPDDNGPLLQFNRGNLRAVLLNAGNSAGVRSNLYKLAKGYNLEPEQVMSWLHTHATKEDWDFAQKVWDIFGEIKGRADTMYRSLTGGVAPESIIINPIATPHGTYAGGYYPIIWHPEFEGTSKKLLGKDPLQQENYVRATTPSGYTQTRTGYTAPLALDLDHLPSRITQELHDIAMRPAVINASKVFYDRDIQSALRIHQGPQIRDLMIPYLRDVANSANYMSKAQSDMARWSEFIRQNMVSTLVGLNPGTVLKHGPTAMVQSMKEVGTLDYLRSTKGLFSINEATGESNWQFAMKESLELQRRQRNYFETLSGATQELVPTGKLDSLRQTIIKAGSTPVAISDLISAVPTWDAAYRSATAKGMSHGDAVYEGDRAVRRAHGSTASTNRPAIMRDSNPWLTSVYTFFNHIMNRQAELVWKAGDMLGDVKEGNHAAAMAKVPEIAGQLFAYVLFPALIEELVTPLATNDKESWGKKAAKGIAFTLGASWVGIRDITSAILNARDPSVGIYSTALSEITNIARDIGKKEPLNTAHAGRLIQDASTLAGLATGAPGAVIGRAARFTQGVATGQEHPRGPWGWLVGARYGTLKHHAGTFQNWKEGKPW